MQLSSTASIDEVMTEAIGGFLQGIFSLMAISWIIGLLMLVGVVALLTWVVKKVWNAGNNKPKVHKPEAHNQWTEDWMQNANARQQNRYEYSDPQWTRNNGKWSPSGWYFDEQKQKWVAPDYVDSSRNTRWEWNERAKMWVDPEQMNTQKHEDGYEIARQRWEAYKREEEAKEAEIIEAQREKARIERHQRQVLREKNAPVYLTEEEKELAKKIKVDRSQPSFEEWKAAREREQGKGE